MYLLIYILFYFLLRHTNSTLRDLVRAMAWSNYANALMVIGHKIYIYILARKNKRFLSPLKLNMIDLCFDAFLNTENR
jgi:hypothetical protein